MSKSVNEWLREGERLFAAGVAECEAIEDRITQLAGLLTERRAAVAEVGRVLGRQADHGPRVRHAAAPSDREARGAVRAAPEVALDPRATRDAIAGAFVTAGGGRH
jgi:hypothetical protein